MTRRLFGAALLTLCLAACCLASRPAGAGEQGRGMPFNKQTMFNYLNQVEQERRELPDGMPLEEYQERVCSLYAMRARQGGHDFEATVQNALQLADRGKDRLSDPRFIFLATVFQVHPDVYLRLKFISKATRDAVLAYFGN